LSKSVKSDGQTDALLRELCHAGLTGYQAEQVDELLDDNTLNQASYLTLLLLGYTYATAFKTPSWAVHKHMLHRARQSKSWRAFEAGLTPKFDPARDTDDPLAKLLVLKQEQQAEEYAERPAIVDDPPTADELAEQITAGEEVEYGTH
jgi:hypothetical protein